MCASLEAGYTSGRRGNRNIITSVVKTVLFCSSSNFPLRVYSEKKENFVNLHELFIDAGDKVLKKRFVPMAGNAKYAILPK